MQSVMFKTAGIPLFIWHITITGTKMLSIYLHPHLGALSAQLPGKSFRVTQRLKNPKQENNLDNCKLKMKNWQYIHEKKKMCAFH